MAEVISPQLLKVLTDVTGELRLDSALRIVAQEAVAHRLERLAEQIRALEQKYGTSFAEFDKRFQAGEIPDQHSYEVEQDYLEWEGLLCRQRRVKELLRSSWNFSCERMLVSLNQTTRHSDTAQRLR